MRIKIFLKHILLLSVALLSTGCGNTDRGVLWCQGYTLHNLPFWGDFVRCVALTLLAPFKISCVRPPLENGFSQSPAYVINAYAQGGPYIVSRRLDTDVATLRRSAAFALN